MSQLPGADWREAVNTEIRRRVISKILGALKECITETDPAALANLAAQIESSVFKQAKSQQEYFKFTAEKIYTLQRKKQAQFPQQAGAQMGQRMGQQPMGQQQLGQQQPMGQQQVQQQRLLEQQMSAKPMPLSAQQQMGQQPPAQPSSSQMGQMQMQMQSQQMGQQALAQHQMAQMAQMGQMGSQMAQQMAQMGQPMAQMQMQSQQMGQGQQMGQTMMQTHMVPGASGGQNLPIRPMMHRTPVLSSGQTINIGPGGQGVTTTTLGTMAGAPKAPMQAGDSMGVMMPMQAAPTPQAPNPATLQNVLMQQNIAAFQSVPGAGAGTAGAGTTAVNVGAPAVNEAEAEKYMTKLKAMGQYVGPLAHMIKQLEKHIENYSNDKVKQDNLKLVNKKMISLYKLLVHPGYPSATPNVQVLEAAERQIKHWLQQLPQPAPQTAAPAPAPVAPPAAPLPEPAPPQQMVAQVSPPQQPAVPSPPPLQPVNIETKAESATTTSPPPVAQPVVPPTAAPAPAAETRSDAKPVPPQHPKNTFVRFVEMVRELDSPSIANSSKLFAQVLDQFASGASKTDSWDTAAHAGYEPMAGESYGFWFEGGGKEPMAEDTATQEAEWQPMQFVSRRWDKGHKKKGEKRKREEEEKVKV